MIKTVLMEMEPADAQHHFDRCIAAGLWDPSGGAGAPESEDAESKA